jgi:5-methyltetrahydrofolate--homocysteine methyltransferase
MELQGKYPRIQEDNVVGSEAKKLSPTTQGHAQSASLREVAERPRRGRLLAGQCGRRRHELFTDDTRKTHLATLHTLRPADGPREPPVTGPTRRWADFIAPGETVACRLHGGLRGQRRHRRGGTRRRASSNKTDDYSRIMLKALDDRLAEALRRAPARAACAASYGGMPRASA